MGDDEGLTRKSTRMASIEAAKRIKKNAEANKSRSHDDEEENELNEVTIFKPLVVVSIDDGSDNNNTQRRGRKRKMSNQVFDSTKPPSKVEAMHDSSKKFTKFVEVRHSKGESMSKRRRGRPPKSQYAKCIIPNISKKYKKSELKLEEEVDYAINLRRESYSNSLTKNESILTTVFYSPKQLLPVTGGTSYTESLMKFSKDLGPTARKVANRMLLGQGANYHTRHRLPLLDTHPQPCFLDLGSINGSIKNTKTNHVGQPLTSFGGSNTYANYISDYKGKKIMVDDGKNNGNKWDINNLENLLGNKMKDGVRICNKGNGSSENQDFGLGQVGINRRIVVGEIGSFLSNNNGNLQKNIDMIGDEKEGVWNASEATRRNGKLNSCVYSSTYLQPSRMVSSSSLMGLDGGVMNLIPGVPPPLEYYHRPPPPVQPPQPPEIKNSVVNDGFCLQEEMQLALATYMQMKDQESNVLFQDNNLLI